MPHIGGMVQYLLLRGGTKLFGLLGGDGGRHVERLHELVVAVLLIKLQLGHKVVSEGGDGLDAVLQLAVTEVVQQFAHLERTEAQIVKQNIHNRRFRIKSFISLSAYVLFDVVFE